MNKLSFYHIYYTSMYFPTYFKKSLSLFSIFQAEKYQKPRVAQDFYTVLQFVKYQLWKYS